MAKHLDFVNYFDVLGLTIEEIENLSNAEVEKRVQDAYEKEENKLRSHKNNPRTVKKLKLLEDAKNTLIKKDERERHITKLGHVKRDEFINFVNTLKTTSSTITSERYNGLLQLAQSEYGLTSDEIEVILENSGLEVKESDIGQKTPVLPDPIDEFTTFLAAVKASSSKITVAQSKGFLKRATQDYGLTDAEAKRILAKSGLVVEGNARTVLKLSIAAVLVALLVVGGIVIYSEWWSESARLAAERTKLAEKRDQLIEKFGLKRSIDLQLAGALNLPLLTQNLLGKGSDVNVSDDIGRRPLHFAAANNSSKTATVLLKNGAEVNAKDNDRNTPLHYAAPKDSLDTVKILLKNGADINAKNNNGETPLHYAASKDSLDTVKILLKNGADINTKNNNGNTPLHYVAPRYSPETAEVLLKNGAYINAKNNNGSTPLHFAALRYSPETAEVLLNNRAAVNVKDEDGNTPLHVAAYKDSAYTAEYLIKNGADINAKNNNGNTPLQIAKEKNAGRTVAVLQKYGKK